MRLPSGVLVVAATSLVACGGGGGSGGASSTAPPAADPVENILLVVLDDIGLDKLRMYDGGSSAPETPTLDALAARGIRFSTVWSAPICTPTRAMIQTGRYGVETGMGWLSLWDGLPREELTLPEMLDAGTNGAYANAAIGKWHLGHNAGSGGPDSPNLAGYDHYSGTVENSDYFQRLKNVNGVEFQTTEYTTTDEIDDALDWIGQAEEPWFCYLALHAAHRPFHEPPNGLYTSDLSNAGPVETDPIPYYHAMIESVDLELERLFDGIGTALAHTHVIVAGDNGTPQDVIAPPLDPLHGKFTLYEGGIRVPLVIAGPRVGVPGSTSDALVNLTDLFATVADLAGAPASLVPPTSISLAPYLDDPGTPSQREYLYSEVFLPNGPAFAQPILPSAQSFYCQNDVGFAGPGTAQLTVCGAELASGNTANISITGAPPNAPVTLMSRFSFKEIPAATLPMFGGELIAAPPFTNILPGVGQNISIENLVTDSAGQLVVPGLGGSGPTFLYLQALVEDPSMPDGFQISNAVSVAFWPLNQKSVRDSRYKLISSVNGGPEELYDLFLDPLELDNLLDQPFLDPAAAAAFADLRTELLRFIEDPAQ